MKPAFVIFTIILLSILLAGDQMFANRKSTAPTVTAAQIQAFKADSNNSDRFLIVDVRDQAETDVSMIPGAITQAEFEQTKQNHQGKTVIAYCTVGYRSGIVTEKLRDDGWDAWNYQGSILDWCRNQLPVVTPGGEDTNKVHTYSSSYALAAGYQRVF